MSKPTPRDEKLPPLRIIQKNIQQGWKKCHKRYQYILNNGDVIRIRKYFQGKSFHLNEWKKINFIAIQLLCASGNTGRMERAKEVTTQCPEKVRRKTDYFPIILPYYLTPNFLYLGWSCFCSKLIDANTSSNRLFPGVVGVVIGTKLEPWTLQRRPRNELTIWLRRDRIDRMAWASLGRCPGQGERLTSIGGSQEGAMGATVFLLCCETLGALGMCEGAEWAGEGGHPSWGSRAN